MSFDVSDKITIIIISSIIGVILIVLILSSVIWCIVRHYRLKAQRLNSNEENNSPPIPSYHRQHYQRSNRLPSVKINTDNNNKNNDNNIKKKKKRRRFNTNESALTLSFDPPHLINQNVKNLEKLLSSESTMTANSWHYEETFPKKPRYCTNPSGEPVYASSSTVLTAVSNLTVPSYNINNSQIHFINELDNVLRVKQEERVKHPLKYTQSCRQTTDILPFDYYRSISPSSTVVGAYSSNNNSLEPIYSRANKYSNITLMRKARLAQLRDDTAILY